ncbi:MAG: HAMP domain-containing histidine kinase [Chloroflexi bacterium]|nr:HAMP domain-containing histidine kinase [Chloroflexota bacterium]
MSSPTERLIAATRRRTFATTLALLFLLVAGIGAATAFVGLQALDADVDQALRSSVATAVTALDGEIPRAGERDSDEGLPAASDTFLLVLDQGGSVVSNPSRVRHVGLPVTSALRASGEDLRTVIADGLSVRLLTMPVANDGVVVGYVQGGFVLSLHDRQSASLVASVAAVALAGLIGAALVTLVVTGRSLVPIRRTFEAQARFVADASHELRTPAALIRANAEVLDREALVSEEGQPLLGDIIGEADRLASLVEDLLALAASDATGLVLQRTSIDVAALVRDTVRGATALAAQHQVTLVADAPGPALAQVDRARFTQVLLVLLDNAIDHAPAGSAVTVSVRREDRRVAVIVEDEGPGVAADEREAIFEPFSSGSAGRDRRRGGTGLGLSIARRIVDAHGGSIEVSQVGGRGARFTVSLPASDAGA